MKKIFILFLFFISFTENVRADSVNNKILSISSKLLDKPYLLNPLGEEGGIDKDPLFREDFFDCLTFVETVLAKSFSNGKDIISFMNKIRYKDGVVSFETRNHFQNPDWIKNNKNLENVSDEISKFILNKNSSKSTIELDRKLWFKKNYNIDFDSEKEIVSLDYISLSDLSNNMEKFTKFINEPYIFMTVIKDDSLKEKVGTEVDVSHTGFLIKKNDKLYLRHASSIAGKVVDNNLEDYIKRLQKNPKYLGFSLIKIKY